MKLLERDSFGRDYIYNPTKLFSNVRNRLFPSIGIYFIAVFIYFFTFILIMVTLATVSQGSVVVSIVLIMLSFIASFCLMHRISLDTFYNADRVVNFVNLYYMLPKNYKNKYKKLVNTAFNEYSLPLKYKTVEFNEVVYLLNEAISLNNRYEFSEMIKTEIDEIEQIKKNKMDLQSIMEELNDYK